MPKQRFTFEYDSNGDGVPDKDFWNNAQTWFNPTPTPGPQSVTGATPSRTPTATRTPQASASPTPTPWTPIGPSGPQSNPVSQSATGAGPSGGLSVLGMRRAEDNTWVPSSFYTNSPDAQGTSAAKTGGIALPISGPSGYVDFTGQPYSSITPQTGAAPAAGNGIPASQWDAFAAQHGVDMNWWNQFKTTERPAGTQRVTTNAIDYYLPAAGGDPALALQLAQDDNRWGQQFMQQYGRSPNEDEWKWHWGVRANGAANQVQPTTVTALQRIGMSPSGQGQPYASPAPTYR